MANAEVFDSFFRRADLDKDGRISGAEAVAFFQGAGLPQVTLAKIWQFADQGRTGFLSRVEFYNALKLVTVAQTGRDITPDLVRAALTGPAAAQIPPPRINTPTPPTPGFGQSATPQGGSHAPSAELPNPHGALPGQAPLPPGSQGAYNGKTASLPSPQISNGGLTARQLSTQSSTPRVYGGPPTKPQPSSGTSTPGGYGGPATKQLSPQTSSISNAQGGSSGPRLTTQTSSLSRYPPSLGQVQVAPTGFAQQNVTGPPVPTAQPTRPSLGSLFTTNSSWASKGSAPPLSSQASNSTSVSSVQSLLTTPTPTSIQSRPLTPASTGSSMTNPTTHTAGSQPAATTAKDAFGGAAFDGGIDLFGGGFKATPAVSSTSNTTDSTFGGDPFAVSQPTRPAATTPSQPKPSPPLQVEGSIFRVEPVGISTQGSTAQVLTPPMPRMGKSPGTVLTPQTTSRTVPIDLGPLPGGRSPSGPLMGASWPQMTPNDVQRFTSVFTKVDTDNDGKITGEQARELFLSWQLPRGILKQVWDLSDQDNDSMLSMREFCTALYLMERYREGRTLPSVLPPGIHLDNFPAPSGPGPQAPGAFGAPAWRHIPGPPQSPPGALTAPAPVQPPLQYPAPLQMPTKGLLPVGEGAPEPNVPDPYKSRAPLLEDHLVNQLSRDEQEMLKTKHKSAEEADKKVFELDKEILDYKEKIELYRAKLQEIILFKSRCDNRLNETTERAATDRREVENLARKYDQKFKAAGEVSSRLQAEETAFRDIQEKKMDLYNSIAKLEKGGDANESVQGRSDRISSELDELSKILNERGRALGVRPNSQVPPELSFGQHVADNAAEWDEDWDKFDDEGFTAVQDFMDDATANLSTTKNVMSAPWGNGDSLFDDGFDFSSEPTIDNNIFKTEGDEDSLPQKSSSYLRSAGGSDDFPRNGVESPEHDLSTSGSHLGGADDKPTQRYSSMRDSQDFGADTFNGTTSFSSPTGSFDHGRASFNSSDPFGDSGAAWAFHDDDGDSGFRASWGPQGSSLSTQTSLDVTSSRGQRRFGGEKGSIGDSLDLGSLHVSSPRGALFDGSIRISSPGGFDKSRRESSPGGRAFGGTGSPGWAFDRNGNGHDDYRNAFGSPKNTFDSPKNAFGSPKNAFGHPKDSKMSSLFGGSSGFDATPSLFGGSPGASNRVDPYSGGSFLRFDSFGPSSPGAQARTSGASEDHSIIGRDGEKSFQRFDSFNSVKTDVSRRRGFGSDDEADPFGPFGSTGPFGAGGQTPKHSDVWSAF